MSNIEKLVTGLTGKSYRTPSVESDSNAVKFGRLPTANSSARVTGPCGESMEIYLCMLRGFAPASSSPPVGLLTVINLGP